nr:minor capsid protein [uncultured Fusobacterium sp.]
MTMSKEYWVKRFEEEEIRNSKASLKELQTAKKQYRNSIDKINDELRLWYSKYAVENNLSYQDAQKLLTSSEKKKLKLSLEEYIKLGEEQNTKFDPKVEKLLKQISSEVHINRLEALKSNLQAELDVLYSGIDRGLGNHFNNVINESYARTSYLVQSMSGAYTVIDTINQDLVNKIIFKPWTSDGVNWSNRLWKQKDKLIDEVHTALTQSLLLGDNINTLVDKVARRMDVGYSRVANLLLTESAAYHSKATELCYKDLGVEKYEILATLDSRTSNICQKMDGKIFDRKDYKVGITAPPFHCRCFDKETEVYTRKGWKYFKDLKNEDYVYTINKTTLIPEWQKPIKIINYHYKGMLLSFKGNSFDQVVTPNHDILVQNMDNTVKDKSWKLKRADSVGKKSKHRFLNGCNWVGQKKKFETLAGKKVEIETYLKFMAYWLADGSCTTDRGSYNVKIAQNNNDWMYEELKKLPFKIYKCKESLIIHNKELGEELKQYGKCTDKYIPDNIKNMSPDLIRIFLLAYSKTDGTLRKGKFWKDYQFKDSICFFTSSNKLSGDLGELILKVGGRPSYYLEKCKGKEIKFRNGIYKINENVWRINWNIHIHTWIANLNITELLYDDRVYCVEVERHNTLLVRRHGKVNWSGNCRTTTIPYFEDMTEDETRVARDENNNPVEEKAAVKYGEWREKYYGKNEEIQLKNNEKDSIITIEIDEMTPCLRRLKDNVIVKTEVKEIKYRKSDFKDWLFDWSKTEKKGYQILALYADGDDRIQGAISIKPRKDNLTVEIDIAESAPFNSSYNKKIKGKEYNGVGAHLFAEVCKRSFDLGYDGYVEFIAKTNLISYYQKELGAALIGGQKMVIDEFSAKKLVDRYYKGGQL